jgi:predicted nucleic acid-binding Zn ribbon protein
MNPRRVPKNCSICSKPVEPNKKGIINKTCSTACGNKLKSINSSMCVKTGKISNERGWSY